MPPAASVAVSTARAVATERLIPAWQCSSVDFPLPFANENAARTRGHSLASKAAASGRSRTTITS